VPSLLGVLPTMTQPLLSTVIAVDRPTPPGHSFRSCGTLANSDSFSVVGLNLTIVVPTPCKFAALLKLSIRTSSFSSLSCVIGEIASAYGFWSPLSGTVDVRVC
jgi:hypothetical protein